MDGDYGLPPETSSMAHSSNYMRMVKPIDGTSTKKETSDRIRKSDEELT